LNNGCIEVSPVTVTIGAVIDGVDLASLDDALFSEIELALLDHKVIFFRDQFELTVDQHLALGRRFGELMEPQLITGSPAHAALYVLESSADHRPATDCWHVDSTYLEEPAAISVLCARAVPAVGGDTLWADMERAYDDLPLVMKQRLHGVRTVNSVVKLREYGIGADTIRSVERDVPRVEHPVVRAHPISGRPSIFINRQTVVGLAGFDGTAAEKDRLIAELLALAERPDYQCRFRWTCGAVAIWDNRCTQHYAVADYFPAYRRMERVTVRGTRPVEARPPLTGA
jgi:taurine dioxygenase